MATDQRPASAADQAQALGLALRALRERAGMTQDEAGGAIGLTRQAWQNYEAGVRNSILRTDLQERLARALGLERPDLLREVDRQQGVGPGHHPELRAIEGGRAELRVLGRVKASARGPQLYDIAEPESTVDVSWMFGPNARTLRAAGDSMSGYVESGDLVIYDTSTWPSRGDGCVVELGNGEVYVKEYVHVSQGVLTVKQRFPEETLTFPMAEVKGVYKIRLRGG